MSAAWGRGRILLPSQDEARGFPVSREWYPEFVRVVTTFTAGSTETDDVVALASAHELLPARFVTPRAIEGSPEWVLEQREKARKAAQDRVRQQLRMSERGQRR